MPKNLLDNLFFLFILRIVLSNYKTYNLLLKYPVPFEILSYENKQKLFFIIKLNIFLSKQDTEIVFLLSIGT